jgi:hypothetical protein
MLALLLGIGMLAGTDVFADEPVGVRLTGHVSSDEKRPGAKIQSWPFEIVMEGYDR